MLSLIDLLRVGTVDLDLAAYLAAAVSRGASFLVGALAGGAGKTTVMAALLNFVPRDCELVAADSGATLRRAQNVSAPCRFCYICHEIGAGPYFAYLWGQEARDYFALTGAGHMIATNLHADTLDQCREQLCLENGVDTADFQRCRLCLFVHRIGRGWTDSKRRIVTVWESDGQSPHRCLWKWDPTSDCFQRLEDSQIVPRRDEYLSRVRELLVQMDAAEIYTIADVRRRFLEFAGKHH